ncbi:lactonase family protein [Phytoactinopolyspora halotolerans]|uniref:Lactonase family protein n=1 Tax=Phytoactinopolyspora halotolerans TaxID=1981512 RepID=A0A6L9S123_9ACTN|nr:lactonase family protein [Phytoactinopolyspora halotolerans]NED99154.1 lactonase family protein [Phytoactinopolyspora halotolerans]
MRAYLGAATSGTQGTPATGITVLDVDGASFTPVSDADAPDPRYLALSSDGSVLYAIGERQHGDVRAFRVHGAELAPLGQPQSVDGSGPCHLSIHPSGRYVLSACYGSGTLAVNPINDDGSLGAPTSTVQHAGNGPDSARQEGPHAHMIVTDPGDGPGRGHVLAVDLGTDTVYRYALDETSGVLTLVDELRTPAGAGPRHLVVHGRYAYVANELASTVTVLDLDAGSALSTVSTRPAGTNEISQPSAVRLSDDGRFLYVANRFVDEIAVLSVDGADVELVTAVPCGGDHPRDMVLSPDGAYLYSANQFGDTITTFRVDADTGIPEPVGEPFSTPSPTCISWAR